MRAVILGLQLLFSTLPCFAHAPAAQTYLVQFQDAQGLRSALGVQSPEALYLAQHVSLPVIALSNLHTLIVTTNDPNFVVNMNRFSSVVLVEGEFLHPVPTAPKTDTHFQCRMQSLPIDGGSILTAALPWGINAIHAPQVWAGGVRGAGARIAFLDTGVDKDHPALAANLELAQDFIGDNQKPYAFFDSSGHGTHCAGIAVGNDPSQNFSGVAPAAHFLMGRVCNDQGCPNTAVAQGLDWAIKQKVDVINISWGSEDQSDVEKSGIQLAEAAGILVVAASGNEGTSQVGFPAAFPNVVAVGAVDSTLQRASFSQWGPELALMAPGVFVRSSVPRGTGRVASLKTNMGGNSQIGGEATNPLQANIAQGSYDLRQALTAGLIVAGAGQAEDYKSINAAGKWVLVTRGSDSLMDKVQNAIAASAVGLLVYNTVPGSWDGILTNDGTVVSIPVMLLDQSSGQRLQQLQLISGLQVTVQTLPSDYANNSGTSMSAPHVAGVAALLRSQQKSLTPAQIRNILRQSASPITGAQPGQVGAGLLDAAAALRAVQTSSLASPAARWH